MNNQIITTGKTQSSSGPIKHFVYVNLLILRGQPGAVLQVRTPGRGGFRDWPVTGQGLHWGSPPSGCTLGTLGCVTRGVSCAVHSEQHTQSSYCWCLARLLGEKTGGGGCLLGQWLSASGPHGFLKCAVPTVQSGAPAFFPLRLSNFKNDSRQHNNSRPVWMNKNYTYFLVRSAKNIFFWCAADF